MIQNPVVVTGVTSFIGSHVARAFAGAGYGVIGTYYTLPERMDPLRHARWRWIQSSLAASAWLDLTDAAAIRELIAVHRPRLWVHQAGLGKHFESDRYDLAESNRIDLLPLQAIYAGMAEAGGAVLATGSGMTYGAADCPHAEDAACWPQSRYGLAKLAATLLARQLAFRHRVVTRIARVYIVFGEFSSPERLVARLFARLRAGERIGIAPGISRDVCDVADVAQGYLRLAVDCVHGPLFDIFNLSRGTAMPLVDVARLTARQLGVSPDMVFEDPSMLRAGESPVACGDSRKAFNRLGWMPRPIEDGLARLAHEAFSRSEMSLFPRQKFSIVGGNQAT
jgi:nucleoside-diphosphate-sugar epimerase